MRSITERFNIFIFITRLYYRIYDELHDWFVIHFTDSVRMREPDEYPCPSATMTCPPEETVQFSVSPRPAQNPAEQAWQKHIGWDSYSLDERKGFFAGYEASEQEIQQLQAERDDWERCARSLHESFHKMTNSYVQKLLADVREMYSEQFPETPVRKPEPECEIGKCKNSR